MSFVAFSAWAFGGSVAAGLLGALLGLGGGIIVIPLLTLLLHVPIHVAVGASVISVVATSTASAASYVRQHLTNIRIGMFLETATATGALLGALIAGWVPGRWLFLAFAAILGYTAFYMFQHRHADATPATQDHSLAQKLHLASSYTDEQGQIIHYHVPRVWPTYLVSLLAGGFSGLLGIGGGIFKVPAMDAWMRLPIKVATATSNFMIGVTAATGATVYLARGQIDPLVAAPVALGVVLGARLGAKVMPRIPSHILRLLFVPVLIWIAIQMILKGVASA
ncbi:MAG: sulfite exporter TauE/SafE family protein [Limnochordaceae bacterium]|nr:sulfite exporter TauE/SafE family protein [Limnochordaceae bacterium]